MPPSKDGVGTLLGPNQDSSLNDLPIDPAAKAMALHHEPAFTNQVWQGHTYRSLYAAVPANRQRQQNQQGQVQKQQVQKQQVQKQQIQKQQIQGKPGQPGQKNNSNVAAKVGQVNGEPNGQTDGQPLQAVRSIASMDSVNDALGLLDLAFLLLIPAAVLIAFGISAALARIVLGPVRRMTASAQEIDADRLDRRLPDLGTDEFGELATAFNQLLAKVETAYEDQAKALAAQKRFTADAAHELKSPLTVISGNAQLAASTADDPQTRRSVQEIERESQSMMKIVQDLLLLSRLESAPDLNMIEIGVIDVLQSASASASSAVQIADTPSDLRFNGDEASLVRLFRNLIENAVNASDAGGNGSQLPLVHLSARASDSGMVAVKVSDHGCGLPPEALAHLTERFYQVDPARSRARSDAGQASAGLRASGTGLGLAICFQIVQLHGGSMSFESEIGKGTTVTVSLPKAVG